MDKNELKRRLPLVVFILSASVLVFLAGIFLSEAPNPVRSEARKGYEALREVMLRSVPLSRRQDLPWYYRRVGTSGQPIRLYRKGAEQGLNLVTRMGDKLRPAAQLESMDGTVLHSWNVDWFERWPEPTHLPARAVPRSRPGTHLHGAVLLENGNLVFNYDHLGTLCLAPDGEVVWRLPERTHHSIHEGDDGHLWICGQKTRSDPDPDYPDRTLPYDEYTVLEVSQAGEILSDWSIERILRRNGLGELIINNEPLDHPLVLDDILHLNDAEPFPSSMTPGVFRPGDIMVSLRNVHVVLVFDRKTEEIRYLSKPGMFRYQHDPDFIDGNTFSVLDNNPKAPNEELTDRQSRVVVVSALDDSVEVSFEGSAKIPFATAMLGKHQWLENGNLLVVESMQGRAIEIDREGEIVWERVNYVDEGVVGIMEEVQRLPLERAARFE